MQTSALAGKHILIGVCGSISAYKAAFLVRLLVKEGAFVKVIMTEAATTFITPLTLSTLSKDKVFVHFTEDKSGSWNNHVELALWADLFVIAPATADTVASAANGQCPNLLLATYLSAKCKVLWCPAMDLDMYVHPATQANLDRLKLYGNLVLEAEYGELASGLIGKGRLAEPEHILEYVIGHFNQPKPLSGVKLLITAGPTYEPLDPVRYIGNHSTGKMGIALAKQASKLGAEVTIVLGPTHLQVDNSAIKVIRVETALEMLAASQTDFSKTDIFIFAAAVADYRPESIAEHKIKKQPGDDMQIRLIQNPDIAKTLGHHKLPNQVMVGFALETENLIAHAHKKLIAKNLDLIVLNDAKQEGAGFGTDTNIVTLIDKDQEQLLPKLSKDDVAIAILNKAMDILKSSKLAVNA